MRTNLRALQRALERYPEPVPTPLARERAKAPYSEAEIEASACTTKVEELLGDSGYSYPELSLQPTC